jgi:hypothetical protein
MSNRVLEKVPLIIALIFAIEFSFYFAGPALLRAYVVTGIGDYQAMHLLYAVPQKEIVNPKVDKRYLAELTRYTLSGLQILAPKNFTLVKERVHKVYYKRKARQQAGSVIYLLHQPPGFFMNLFPQARKQGVKNDYEFFLHTMYATIEGMNDFSDAFFVIIKTIFTPGMGDQKEIKIIEFSSPHQKGFVTFNLTPKENYFDCNIIDSQGDFLKVYIKDKGATLDLDKVLQIISTLKIKDGV